MFPVIGRAWTELKKHKNQIIILCLIVSSVTNGLYGYILTGRLNEVNAVRADQLARQFDKDKQREKLRLIGYYPCDIRFDLKQGKKIVSYSVECTNESEVSVVIDVGAFFRIRGLADSGILLSMNEGFITTTVLDNATGKLCQPHLRLDAKSIQDYRIQVTHSASVADKKAINDALISGWLRSDADGCVQVPVFDVTGQGRQIKLGENDLLLYFQIQTSLGMKEEISLGGI